MSQAGIPPRTDFGDARLPSSGVSTVSARSEGIPGWMRTPKFFLQILIVCMILFSCARSLWWSYSDWRKPVITEYTCVPLGGIKPYTPGYYPVKARHELDNNEYGAKVRSMNGLLGALDSCPQGACNEEARRSLGYSLRKYVSIRARLVRQYDEVSGEDGIRWVHSIYGEGGDLTIRSEMEQRVKSKDIDLAKMTPEDRALFRLMFLKPIAAFVSCRK